MSTSSNHYVTLGVSPQADLATIKRAYREKMRLYHPDKLIAERHQAQQQGSSSLSEEQLKQRIAYAKTMTQRINAAYAILSDAQARSAYDRHLSQERQRQYDLEQRQHRMRHYEGARRTVKARPHRRNPTRPSASAPSDSLPWVLFATLIIILIVVSTLFANAVTRVMNPFDEYVPRNPTADGIHMADLQATTQAHQATLSARSTMVLAPTATARASSDSELLGDRMMGFSLYDNAEELYTEALAIDTDNALLYMKRARAYQALFENGNEDARELALGDYEQALQLDETLVIVYLERGLFYYDLWLTNPLYGRSARRDLEQYLALSEGQHPNIEALLLDLPK